MSKKKSPKKLTQNQKLFKQEAAKLKRIISRNLGSNYDVNYEKILELTDNLVMPKRVTQKKLEQIRKMRDPKYFHKEFTNKLDPTKHFEHSIPEGFNAKEDFKLRTSGKAAPVEIVDWVEDELSRIPDVRVFYYRGQEVSRLNTSLYRNEFYAIYDRQKYNGKQTYIKYLESVQDQIVDAIETISFTNYEEMCYTACLELAELLKGNSLTLSETEKFSEIAEMLNESLIDN